MQGSYQDRPKKRTTTATTQSETRADYSPRPCEGTSRVAHTHIPLSHHETWKLLPLSHPLVNPTTSTSVQDNTELTSSIGCRVLLGPNQYKSPVFFSHTIRTPDAQTLDYSLVLGPPFLTPTVGTPDRGCLHVMTNHFYRVQNGYIVSPSPDEHVLGGQR
jgi:hypothetical protein